MGGNCQVLNYMQMFGLLAEVCKHFLKIILKNGMDSEKKGLHFSCTAMHATILIYITKVSIEYKLLASINRT